ncbi:MAG: hypothetical protein FWB82_02580, partial [Treponema sp.]|nr:hypothetical protein [Treponema sp.]
MGRGQELHQLPNPDNVPAGVTTGYQRQNNNIFAIQTGLCTMEPHDNGDSITIPYGGVIEFNGVMYALGQTVTLPKPNPSVAYWVAVASSENNPDYATFLLVTRPGRWVPAKQGSYNLRGQRTIDWVSMGELAPPRPTGTAFSQSVKGTANIRLQKGWYYVELRSGRGGGDGERINGGKADQELQHNIIVFSRGETHRIKVGGSGEPGQSGGRGLTPLTFWMLPDIGHGGGGGGGGGEESYFDCHSTGAVQGGYGADGNSAQRASGGRGGSVGQSGRSPAVFPTG